MGDKWLGDSELSQSITMAAVAGEDITAGANIEIRVDQRTGVGTAYAKRGPTGEDLCRCGHVKGDHSNAREEDFGCNVDGCWDSGECRGWNPR